MRHAVALDIGGTKLEAGVVDERGRILRRQRRPTPVGEGAEALFDAARRLVEAVRGGDEVVCGVGCGGPMTRDGARVSPLHLPAWRDFPLRSRLATTTGLPTTVDNDAKAIALAEAWTGAAAGARNLLGMVVSTGVGGGLLVDGRLLGGNAGHVGHVVVRPDGRRCRCGGRGCLEAEISGTAVAERTGRPAADATVEEIADAGTLLGRAVAAVVAICDVRLAVVAGSVAIGWGPPFFDAANAELTARARVAVDPPPRIVPARLGADAPLVGAAAIGWRALAAEVRRSRR